MRTVKTAMGMLLSGMLLFGSTPPYQVITTTLACQPFLCQSDLSLDIGQPGSVRTDIFASCNSGEYPSAFGAVYTTGCTNPALLATQAWWGESDTPPTEVGYLDDLGNYDLAEAVLGAGVVYIDVLGYVYVNYEMSSIADCFSSSVRVSAPPSVPC
jgi:hypothetical protein